MDQISGPLKALMSNPVQNREHSGNSFSDRLNSTYTVSLLVLFAFFIQFSQIFGDPVECWCPAHFTDTHSAYTNKVCWTSNTFFLPYDRRIDPSRDDREYVSYYQWVSLALVFQAVFFMVPKVLWTAVSSMSGVAVYTITDAAIKCNQASSHEDRQKRIDYMVNHLDRAFTKVVYGRCSEVKGYFLPICYLIVKGLYFTNVVAQLFIIDNFLNTDYHLYGIEIIRKMAVGESWINSNRFPRVTLCDFNIRLLGNVHRYTVQCSLHMNLFNEIIYIFLWFWFVLVAATTAGSFVLWFLNLCVIRINQNFIRKRLIAIGAFGDIRYENKDAEITNYVYPFVKNYMRGDGCFILRMVSKNASDIVASEVIEGLFNNWKKRHEAKSGGKINIARGLRNSLAQRSGQEGAADLKSFMARYK